MEGSQQIDTLMIPVMKAIKKHVKGRDAQTEIYNRAYEAIQTSMDVTPEQANSLLRSAFSIASREGKSTNWEAFKKSVEAELKLEHQRNQGLHLPEPAKPKISNFAVLDRICEIDPKGDILKAFMSPENVIAMETGRDGWGWIKIAIPNSTITEHVIGEKQVKFVLLAYDLDAFHSIAKSLEED